MGLAEERRALRALAEFPRIKGFIQSVIPFTRCVTCAKTEPLERSGTHVAYDGDPTCLKHAKWLARHQRNRREAVAVLEKLREER